MSTNPPQIFINYRRDDSQAFANLLAALLSHHFGEDAVFLDTTSIPEGAIWPDRIRDALAASKVVFVVIGKSWLTLQGKGGRRRIDLPQDWVRTELQFALGNEKILIPIRSDQDAQFPAADDLPESIVKLAEFEAAEFRYEALKRDIERLAETLRTTHGIQPTGRGGSVLGDPKVQADLSTVPANVGPGDLVARSDRSTKSQENAPLLNVKIKGWFVFAFTYWLVAAVLPLAALYFDSGCDFHSDFFRTSVRVYSHLFLYPLTCGPIAAGVVWMPLSGMMKREGRQKLLIGLTGFFALVVTVADFSLGNSAIWEVEASARSEGLMEFFVQPEQGQDGRSDYGRRLDEAVANGRVSFTRRVYPFGLFMQMSALIAVPFMLLDAILTGNWPSEAIRQLTLTLLISTLWLLCRIAFLFDKRILYDTVSLGALDAINLLLFLVSYMCSFHLVQRLEANEALVWRLFLGFAILAVVSQFMFAKAALLNSHFVGRNCQEINHVFCGMFLALVLAVMPFGKKNSS